MKEMSDDVDPFRVLGVERGCGSKSIRTAYKTLAMSHHPDKTGGDAEEFHRLKRCVAS